MCWEAEAHDRPSFEKILMLLDEVARSPFAQTPHESFHTMQEDWKMEIEAMFDDIRLKEKVTCVRRQTPRAYQPNKGPWKRIEMMIIIQMDVSWIYIFK